jgi:hypothetical protein
VAQGFFVVLILAGLYGCTSPSSYGGDGAFSDFGATRATDRYVLDLGPIGRAGQTVHEFSLSSLPSTEFVVGFQVASVSPEQARRRAEQLGVVAELSLTTSDGRVVFNESGQLADWVWGCDVGGCSGAFAYRRGQEREIPLSGGGQRIEHVTGRIDGAWGTYFVPRTGRAYRLGVSIRQGAKFFSENSARVLARGGGWK